MAGPKRVLVAMSGGVDSSVAACLLKEQGHDVVGVFMRLGAAAAGAGEAAAAGAGGAAAAGGDGAATGAGPADGTCADPEGAERSSRACCSAEDADDARAVAGRLGIPFYALNYEADFSRLIDDFCDEYAVGRTPNPCIRCNQRLKFGRLAELARSLDAERIATGHYACVSVDEGRPRLWRAKDRRKDQSYVLFGIEPAVLARTIFPLGELTKEEVRDHARRFGLALHDKAESQDICFVPDGDYASLVRRRRPEAFRPGVLRHCDGRELGRHEGVPHFTVGQRRGLRIASSAPLYVVRIDPRDATVTVGPREALFSREARAEGVTWLCPPPAAGVFRADVKIRYQHEAAPAEVRPQSDESVCVTFDAPQPAVTPGQAMVFYDGDEVLGGGWIASS